MANVRTIYCAADQADAAFEAHAALLKGEAANPALSRNPFWTMLRQDAFERFHNAFRVV